MEPSKSSPASPGSVPRESLSGTAGCCEGLINHSIKQTPCVSRARSPPTDTDIASSPRSIILPSSIMSFSFLRTSLNEEPRITSQEPIKPGGLSGEIHLEKAQYTQALLPPKHVTTNSKVKLSAQSELKAAMQVHITIPKRQFISRCAGSVKKVQVLTKALRRKASAGDKVTKLGQTMYRGGRKVAQELLREQFASLNSDSDGEAERCPLDSQKELFCQDLARRYPEYRRIFMAIPLLVKLSPETIKLSSEQAELVKFVTSAIRHWAS